MSESLSLRLWRDVGRHDDLQSALAAAVEAVRDDLAPRVTAIRYLIAEHRLWETVAIAGSGSHEPLVGTDPVREGRTTTLPAELRRQRMLRVDARTFARRNPGVLPHAAQGSVLLVVLSDEPHVTSVLVISGMGNRELSPKLRRVVHAMIEPLASALRQHVRQRDAMTLREAAEADRRSLLSKLGRSEISDVVVGADAGLRDVMERVAQVARSNAPVLLLGETGSGKEVVAREVHRGSDRAAGPFVRVNCGAIPGDLIDSELFGHERGSFTGATQRKGWFERADAGTLFLDEVAELPLPAQVRLLRVLHDGLVQRVGGEHAITVDVRVIAATNQDLQLMMREGRFREDLWYRLAVFPINLPTLRDRIGDLPALAMHFAQRAAARLGLPVRAPTDDDMRLLCGYEWPGNIRELGSVIERAAILGNGRRLEVSKALGITSPTAATRHFQLPSAEPSNSHPKEGAFATLDEQARTHIESALRKCLGRVDGPFGAALLLGLNAQTLRSRMKRLGIHAAPFRIGRRRA